MQSTEDLQATPNKDSWCGHRQKDSLCEREYRFGLELALKTFRKVPVRYLGSWWNTVSRVLFRKRELIEFWANSVSTVKSSVRPLSHTNKGREELTELGARNRIRAVSEYLRQQS